VKADATDLPPPARALIAPERAEAVTALYQAHALGLIRLAVVMLSDRGAAEHAAGAKRRHGHRPRRRGRRLVRIEA